MQYTYLIGWSKQNKFYYGARWAKNCSPSDLWVTYFTSSKHVKNFRKDHGEPDIIQIRKIFEDAEQCKSYERKVLTRLNVLNNNKWLNKNINGMFLPHGPQAAEHLKKRVIAGVKTKEKNGTLHKTPWTKTTHPEASKKLKAAQIGKPKSPQHIANMKDRPQDTLSLTCPHCQKIGDYKNMKRWHLDRCIHNPNRINDKDPKTVTCSKCGHTSLQSPNFYRYHGDNCST